MAVVGVISTLITTQKVANVQKLNAIIWIALEGEMRVMSIVRVEVEILARVRVL